MTRFDLHDGFHLSPIRDGDQAAYLEHFRDKETTDHLLLVPYPYTEQDANAWVLTRLEAALEQPRETQFALRRHDGFLIGGIGFMLGKGVSAHRGELGYWVAKDYRRRGLAAAAIEAIIAYAFRDVGLRRLQAWVFVHNAASQRVLERAGFRREGLLQGYHLKNEVLLDTIIYGLLDPHSASTSARLLRPRQ
jgi:ribosomal-protein-alanine N-acetyltransferase